MTLYEIDERIMALADPETGEITDFGALDELQMARDQKIENVALWWKDLTADAKAIADEIAALKARLAAKQKQADKLMEYLEYALCGRKFETAAVKVTTRKTSSVQTDEQFVPWAIENAPHLVRMAAPEPDKLAIRVALETREVPHARMECKYSMTIK